MVSHYVSYNQLTKIINLQVTRPHARHDTLFGDFCDATFFKNHSLFSSGDESLLLQFIIYYDDVEVTNPLGSSKGKHKLGKD